jgi:peptidoglycan/LPS O-acetylase OafA/YrhL
VNIDAANLVVREPAPKDVGAGTPPARLCSGRVGSDRMRYIDGLRAVAIIAVVAFHAKLPGFSGGFTGVDVFFVISGFLITRQIAGQAIAGRFSPADFYARRMTRILPPLLLVTLAVIACEGWFPLLPSERKDIDLSAAAAAAMVSNYYFAAGTEYFSRASEIVPLLHTWSLGVEEQYYLFAPFVISVTIHLAARRKRSPRHMLFAVAIAALAISWAIGAVLTYFDHKVAFYSLVSRAWQFAAGAALAVAVLDGPVLSVLVRRAAGVLGALALAAAFLLLDRDTPYPGLAAALPTLGAVLLIAGGVGGEALLTRMLASRPAVAIGAVSYGWYLWHWPVLSFARSLDLAPSVLWRDLAACAVALALAVATYALVERPMKMLRERRIGAPLVRTIIVLGLGSSAAVAVLTFAASRDAALTGQLAAEESALPASQIAGCGGDASPPAFPDGFSCSVGPPGAPGVLLWGDSHALTYSGLAESLATRAGHPALLAGALGCPPLLGVDVAISARPKCWDTSEAIGRWIGSPQGKSVTGAVIVARWPAYNGEETPSAADIKVSRMSWHDVKRPARDFGGMLEESLGAVVKLLRMGRRVLIVGPLPEFRHSVPECLLRAKLYGLPQAFCGSARSSVDSRTGESMRALRRVAGRLPGTMVVDPTDVFCDDTTCLPYGPGGVYFLDDNHLTALGAEMVYRRFQQEFDEVFGLPRPQ